MDPYEQQHEAAARRVLTRTAARREHEQALAGPGGLAAADTPERIAKRVARLVEQGAAAPDRAAATDPALLERIINTKDFVGVRYLEAGAAAGRAVGRVNIRDAAGRLTGFGTGSLVSPALLLTNHHVLDSAETARSSVIEFDYQDGIDGRPLVPQAFPLDPDRFFLADAERDFALVAVRGTPDELARYGFNRLIAAEGKAIIGECVTIVQHPRGERKQVALRENKIVDLAAAFLHYAADTEPGSSGSPVFNDQWEVVALHHASVPAPEHTELGGVVNEGIRISRILAFVREQPLAPAQRALADAILTEGPPVTAGVAMAPPSAADAAHFFVAPQATNGTHVAPEAAGTLTLAAPATNGAIPLEITVRVPAAAPERIEIDPDYGKRGGYSPGFLGSDVPLPAIGPELRDVASPILPYHHFSVVMHRRRALALFTAVNIDGTRLRRLPRERDRWVLDPRLPAGEQTGQAVYEVNALDRGHLVRRLDPAWGATDADAKRANDDTFHWTNCTPQHHEFNAGTTLWAGLEDHILDHAEVDRLRVSVFTGPVLAADDDLYRGVQLPRQFWKVVAMVTTAGRLSVTGYLLSQAALLDAGPGAASFSYGAYRTYQVHVRRIAHLTGLGLDPHVAADPLERMEADKLPRELRRPADLVL